jgi:hypothetical protein
VPPGFSGLEPAESPEFYIALYIGESARSFAEEHYYWLLISARLRPGTTRSARGYDRAATGPETVL